MSIKKKGFMGLFSKTPKAKPFVGAGEVSFSKDEDAASLTEGADSPVESSADETAEISAEETSAEETSAGSGDANVPDVVLTPDLEHGEETEAGRSNQIIQRGPVPAEAAERPLPKPAKPVKLKKEKLPKPPKAPKIAKVKTPKAEEEISLPLNVAVDFYRGVTKERDAEQIARAFVEKNFASPNASYVFVQKWRDGCAVEMQEGGGKAYLPETLAKLDEDEEALVALPMSGRVMQVRLDPDTRSIEALVLTAGQLPTPDTFIALPTKNMIPIDKRGSKVFIAGLGLLAASMITLVFSTGAFFIDTKAWSLPYLQQTRVTDLPSAQTKNMQGLLANADCIAKMEFKGGSWNIVPGYESGGVCSSTNRPVPGDVVDQTMPPVEGGDVAQPQTAPGTMAPSGAQPPALGAKAPAGAPPAVGS